MDLLFLDHLDINRSDDLMYSINLYGNLAIGISHDKVHLYEISPSDRITDYRSLNGLLSPFLDKWKN